MDITLQQKKLEGNLETLPQNNLNKSLTDLETGDMRKSFNTRRILVVDDEPQLLTLLQNFIGEDLGMNVRTAKNSREALEILTGFLPTHVLTDHRMAGMTGITYRR